VVPSALPQKEGEAAPAALNAAGMQASARRSRRPQGRRYAWAWTASRSMARTVICCTSSSRRSPTSAPIDTADRSRTAYTFRSRCSTSCAASRQQTSPSASRFSATDWIQGGWDVEQTIAFVRELKQLGVNWISVSSGGILPLQKIPGTQIPGSLRAGGKGGDGSQYRCRRPDHPSAAGKVDPRNRPRGPGRARQRDAL
jgi:hypothetical protein